MYIYEIIQVLLSSYLFIVAINWNIFKRQIDNKTIRLICFILSIFGFVMVLNTVLENDHFDFLAQIFIIVLQLSFLKADRLA